MQMNSLQGNTNLALSLIFQVFMFYKNKTIIIIPMLAAQTSFVLLLFTFAFIANSHINLSRDYFTSRTWGWVMSDYTYITIFYDNGTMTIGNKPPVTFTWWWNSTLFIYRNNQGQQEIYCRYPTVINSYHPGRNTDIVTTGYCKGIYDGVIYPSSLSEYTS